MLKPSKFALILGLAGAMGVLPSLAAVKDPDAAGVAEAIRFEKAKQAAADRQARIEAAREHASNSADRMAPEPKSKTKTAGTTSATTRKTPPPQQHQ
jgi:hypothetical protein